VEGLDRILLGLSRKSLQVTKDEKLKTAYHEAGHTLMSLLSESHQALHKVTILPRG